MLHYEDWGSDNTYPHMSVAWSWAFDTPFKWTKQVASHFGGTRQGLAISWPGHINDVGGIRTQFHHVIDVVPTILEAAGIKAPATVNGIAQKPIEGVSMVYTFDKANADAPSKRDTQYFEMVGNRAIYHDGWIAATTPPAAPWLLATGKLPDLETGYNWELYNIAKDYSENDDLAAKMPDKLKEMQALFMTEAAKNNVFPLDNTGFSRLLTPRPSAIAGQDRIHLCRREHRHSRRQRSEHSRPRLHHHRRGDDSRRRRRGDDRNARRPLRRLRPLSAPWQAGVRLQFPRSQADPLGRRRGRRRPVHPAARAGQAHDRVRLQIRRSRPRQGRNGRALGRRPRIVEERRSSTRFRC